MSKLIKVLDELDYANLTVEEKKAIGRCFAKIRTVHLTKKERLEIGKRLTASRKKLSTV